MSKSVINDVQDLRYHYDDVAYYSTGNTKEALLKALDQAINLMIDNDAEYQDIKDQLSKTQRKLIYARLENDQANKHSKDLLNKEGI